MSPADRFERRIRARLAELERAGLQRTLHEPCGIDLSSNDYLNLAADPRVTAAFRNAARDGVGSTGSRLLRGHRSGFDRLESRFAAFKGTERAIYFSSGYLANLAVLATVAERGDTIVSDARNHASLIDGMRLSRARVVIAPHNDAAALRRALQESAKNSAAGEAVPPADARGPLTFVVVESLYSMEGDFAPLADYMAACDAFGAVLIVDEAHAVGIYGPNGEGAIAAAGLDANRCLSINTAGKALGAAGALVAGPGWAIDYLVQRARPFVFSTAAPPAIAAAIEASLAIVESEPERRQRVLARAAYLRAALRRAVGSGRARTSAGGIGSAGTSVPAADVPDGTSQIIPIIIGDNERAVSIAQGLQAEGFDVRAIRPPSVPEGTARLRISVNAGLTERALDQFAGLVSAALCSAACS
jgi:8-amino-7-oxononanoate synthase